MSNTLKDLKDFFGVSMEEFKEAWESLTDQEKEEWKNADLTSE